MRTRVSSQFHAPSVTASPPTALPRTPPAAPRNRRDRKNAGRWIILLGIALAFPMSARADTLWISSTGGNLLELGDVKINGIADGAVQFESAGRYTSRPLEQIARMKVDDSPDFTAAEAAYSARKYGAAITAYRATLAATSKPWLKIRAAERMIAAAQQAKQFDAAAEGYIALVQADPAHAAAIKPLPPAGSASPAGAIQIVKNALDNANLPPAQQRLLQNYLADLQKSPGEQAAAQTGEKTTAGAPQAAGSDNAKAQLDAATAAIGKKNFSEAMTIINAHRALFIEPKDQANALYLLAEAQTGSASARNDKNAWQDAAIAYMRVVAHFPSGETAPLAARSLLKTARIEQYLGDADAARSLYEQLIAQYAKDPAAQDAQSALANMDEH